MRGVLKMSSTGPVSTSLPAYITATRSTFPATTPRSWVISTTAAPVTSLAFCSTSRICAWIVTSRAVVGSSAMISAGSFAIAIAIIARWRMPPENSCGKAFTRRSGAGIPTIFSSSTARFSAVRALMFLSWRVSASSICCPMVYTGVRAESGSWKIIAISLPRRRERALSSLSRSDSPRKRISPSTSAELGSRPITAREETDLPDPDSPTMPRNSPSRTW